MTSEDTLQQPRKRGLSGWNIFLIVLITVLVSVAITFWVVRTWIFPAEFSPVELSVKEEQVLEDKLQRFDTLQTGRTRGSAKAVKRNRDNAADGDETVELEVLEPEAYSEEGADRSITLSGRELDGMLAKNTDLARKLAIDLSEASRRHSAIELGLSPRATLQLSAAVRGHATSPSLARRHVGRRRAQVYRALP